MNDDILWKAVELGKGIENLTNEKDFWKRKCNEMGIALNTYEKGKYQEHLENEQLHSIIKEVREYIENCLHNLEGTNDSELKQCIETIHKYLLEILDKVGEE